MTSVVATGIVADTDQAPETTGAEETPAPSDILEPGGVDTKRLQRECRENQ